MMNRLANCHNQYQGTAKRVLCVCSAGLLRSPTAAWVLSNPPFNFNTRSCGAEPEFALIPVDPVLMDWADEVVCMSSAHANAVRLHIPGSGKPIHVLGIPDKFEFREPELVKLITEKAKEIWKLT